MEQLSNFEEDIDFYDGTWHSCPYQEEINGNYDPHYCQCSEEEQYQCAMDI